MNAISARVLKKDAAILGSICYIGLFATIITCRSCQNFACIFEYIIRNIVGKQSVRFKNTCI